MTIFLRIIFFSLIIFYHSTLYAKNTDLIVSNKKIVSNYFSALVSLNNNQNTDSVKFFNSSKDLKESHELYLKKYLFSLVLNQKVSTAIKEIKKVKKKKFTDFFEAQLLLVLDSIKNHNYKKAAFYINNLKDYENEGTFELVITSTLEEYTYLFNGHEISSGLEKRFGNLSLINSAFKNCYLEKPNTESFFDDLINSEKVDYSRYLFFYINYLIGENNLTKARNEILNINPLSSNLLISQTKKWIDEENFDEFGKIFSCKSSNDLIAEFLFLISNLYSSEGDLAKSNYYLNLSIYLNPKFDFNYSLLVENYLENNEFEKTKKILKNFDKKDEIYYWYKIKKMAEIINNENDPEKTFDYINFEFNKIKNPSLKLIYDMGNFAKSFKKYDLSIEYYSKILLQLKPGSLIYADVLYRRGGSHERLGNEKKSDEDLLQSLEIDPNDPMVLNYLAYSWLERNYKINEAIDMLEKAYEQEPNNAYIIDSIGWAYYLVDDYVKAEKFIRRAVEIMTDDPIVNDHYGDILWKLDRKIQAQYFWKNVLTFEDVEEEMKENIYLKLLKGPKKI